MTQLIGIQGGAASYHEQAALLLHADGKLVHFDTFSALFDALKSGRIDTAVCAISNTQIGPIIESNTELAKLEGQYQELGHISLPIHHALLGTPGSTLADVKRVYSQRPALDQCKKFLSTKLPTATLIESDDTALSAKFVAQAGDSANAAIASTVAGKLYGLESLYTGIQDDPNNATSFIEVELIDKIQQRI